MYDASIEDHWINCGDDYEVSIKDFYKIDLALVEKVLGKHISNKV